MDREYVGQNQVFVDYWLRDDALLFSNNLVLRVQSGEVHGVLELFSFAYKTLLKFAILTCLYALTHVLQHDTF